MRFYLQQIYNQKIIKIMFQDEGRSPELMAIIPYKGHKNSWECAVRKELAEVIRIFLEKDKIQSRKNMAEITKLYSINTPWMNVLEK